MKDQIEQLSTSNQHKQEENRKLEAEIQEFQGGTEAIEARARSDFGMVKKGEAFYQIVLDPKQTVPTEKSTPTADPAQAKQTE
jgi:cell division protein FtsB